MGFSWLLLFWERRGSAQEARVVTAASGDHPLPSQTLMGGMEKTRRLPRGRPSVAHPAAPNRAAAEEGLQVACLGGSAS